MKINLQSVKQLAILGVASLVISCGGGDGAVPTPPPVIPKAKISGVVLIGPVTNSEIRIYGFDKNNEVIPKPLYEEVGSGTTNLAGEFSIEVQESAKFTPMLICVEAGTYSEPAAPPNSADPVKTFKDGNKLCAATIFEKGKDQFVSITHFTHIATGLLKYDLSKGGALMDSFEEVPNADPKKKPTIKLTPGSITASNSRVSRWLGGFDIITTKPVDFLNIDFTAPNLSDKPNFKYGLAIIGISSIVDWLSTNGTIEGDFTNVSSISYAQKIYEDAKLDGRLGGRGQGRFAQHDLSLHIVRHHYALRLLSVVSNKAINHTTLDVKDVRGYVETLAEYAGDLFASIPEPQPLNLNIPAIDHPSSNLEGLKTIIKGKATITFSIIDPAGVDPSTVKLSLMRDPDTTPHPNYADQSPDPQDGVDSSKYTWTIFTKTTNKIPDGLYTARVTAYNYSGGTNFFEVSGIKVLNGSIGLVHQSPKPGDLTNPDSALTKSPTAIKKFIVKVTDAFKGSPAVDKKNPPELIKFELLDVNGKVVPNVNLVASAGTGVTGSLTDTLYETTYDLNKSVDGQYILRYTANSALQVVLKDPTLEATTDFPFAIDTIPPKATITVPANGDAFKVLPNLRVTLTDPQDGINSYSSKIGEVKLLIDNIEISPKLYNYKTGIVESLVGLVKEGSHTVYVDVYDRAGNFSKSAVHVFAFDQTPPTIVPDPNANVWRKVLNIGATAADKIGLATVDYKYGTANNLSPAVAISIPPKQKKSVSFTKQIATLANGVYKAVYSATDTAGNPFSVTLGNQGVDTLAPKMTGVSATAPPVIPPEFGAGVQLDTAVSKLATLAKITEPYELGLTENGWVQHTLPNMGASTQSGIDLASISIAGLNRGINDFVTGYSDGALTVKYPFDFTVTQTMLPLHELNTIFTLTRGLTATVTCPLNFVLVATDNAGTLDCKKVLTAASGAGVATAACSNGITVVTANNSAYPENYSGCLGGTAPVYGYKENAASTADVVIKDPDKLTATNVQMPLTKSTKQTLPVSVSDQTQPTGNALANGNICTVKTFVNNETLNTLKRDSITSVNNPVTVINAGTDQQNSYYIGYNIAKTGGLGVITTTTKITSCKVNTSACTLSTATQLACLPTITGCESSKGYANKHIPRYQSISYKAVAPIIAVGQCPR